MTVEMLAFFEFRVFSMRSIGVRVDIQQGSSRRTGQTAKQGPKFTALFITMAGYRQDMHCGCITKLGTYA